LGERLTDTEEYGENGQGRGIGFDNDFAFNVRTDDGLAEDHHFSIGLENGECTGAREVDDPDVVDAGFTYRGDYSDWLALNIGDIGPIDGMMSGVIDIQDDT